MDARDLLRRILRVVHKPQQQLEPVVLLPHKWTQLVHLAELVGGCERDVVEARQVKGVRHQSRCAVASPWVDLRPTRSCELGATIMFLPSGSFQLLAYLRRRNHRLPPNRAWLGSARRIVGILGIPYLVSIAVITWSCIACETARSSMTSTLNRFRSARPPTSASPFLGSGSAPMATATAHRWRSATRRPTPELGPLRKGELDVRWHARMLDLGAELYAKMSS